MSLAARESLPVRYERERRARVEFDADAYVEGLLDLLRGALASCGARSIAALRWR